VASSCEINHYVGMRVASVVLIFYLDVESEKLNLQLRGKCEMK
jgi:hypothetical protein